MLIKKNMKKTKHMSTFHSIFCLSIGYIGSPALDALGNRGFGRQRETVSKFSKSLCEYLHLLLNIYSFLGSLNTTNSLFT